MKGEAVMADQAAWEVGALVVDAALDRVGVLMGEVGGRVQLRPVGGGLEWDAMPDEVRPATAYDELRARVGQANADSGWGR